MNDTPKIPSELSNRPARRWIIILNRSPKGPVSASEILLLLEKGLLRRNDLACRLEDTPGVKSEWKLIWQFEEFDRRNLAVNFSDPKEFKKTSKIEGERRVDGPSPEEMRLQALKELPPDWQNISPEDLLPRSKQQSSNNPQAEQSPNEIFEGAATTLSSFEWSLWFYRYVPTTIGIIAVASILYFMPPFWSKAAPKAALVAPSERRLSLPKRIPAEMREEDVPVPTSTDFSKGPAMRSRASSPPIETEEPILEARDSDPGEIEEPVKKKSKKSTIQAKKSRKKEVDEEEVEESDEERDNASVEEDSAEEPSEEEQEP